LSDCEEVSGGATSFGFWGRGAFELDLSAGLADRPKVGLGKPAVTSFTAGEIVGLDSLTGTGEAGA
jgi:hypothetical protein